MKVEYIYHSGFTIETDNYFLVFDYYRGHINLKDKRTLVFASHGHKDHFNPLVLDWQENNPNISYILSSDIGLEPSSNIHIMRAYEEINLDGVKIKSFSSTDLGLSFLIELEGKTIFYSGDLNWWHWENDSRETQLQEEKDYKDELEKLGSVEIDLAFVPVDPRLGIGFDYAGRYFIEKFKPKVFFPMHFGDKPETSKDFIHNLRDVDVNILEIERENQIFEIK